MTMLDKKCDVCGVGEAIGVACTAIPYSCAYCVECARRHAEPELVFQCWKDDGLSPDQHRDPDDYVTYKDGKYITYRQWYEAQND